MSEKKSEEIDAGTQKALDEINEFCANFFSTPKSTELKAAESKSPQEEPPSPDEVKKEIESLVGLSTIKEDIDALMDFIKVQLLREAHELPNSSISLHTAFIGNPGTGKTTIARLMGKYFKAIGILAKGHIVEVSRADLVAAHVGGTAEKTNKVIDSALDGILFIDEAYSLSTGSSNDYGQEAINILVDRMEKERGRLAVFFAGYDEEMTGFFESNSGLSSRVTRKFYFDDYNGDELLQILKIICDKQQYTIGQKASLLLKSYFDYIYAVRDSNFGNGREVRNVFEKLIKSQANRLAEIENLSKSMLMAVTDADVEAAIKVSNILITDDSINSALDELNHYVGLENIKEHIQNLINLVKTNRKREELGLPVKEMTFHAIFSGSPGTGKTSIARILGKIYRSLGILKKGHIIEVDRSGLVGSYVGQTEAKTSELVDQALDGILFVDEAYALAGENNDFGQIAIDTILKRMDDDRKRLVVIVAGYSKEMELFIDTNPGLKDRFTQHFKFKDYSGQELFDIFNLLANKQQYILSEKASQALKEYFEDVAKNPPANFGNGRTVRNLFEFVVRIQSNRLVNIETLTLEEISLFTEEDIVKAISSQ